MNAVWVETSLFLFWFWKRGPEPTFRGKKGLGRNPPMAAEAPLVYKLLGPESPIAAENFFQEMHREEGSTVHLITSIPIDII
jgi:hypothetical protein